MHQLHAVFAGLHGQSHIHILIVSHFRVHSLAVESDSESVISGFGAGGAFGG